MFVSRSFKVGVFHVVDQINVEFRSDRLPTAAILPVLLPWKSEQILYDKPCVQLLDVFASGLSILIEVVYGMSLKIDFTIASTYWPKCSRICQE